MPSRTVQLLKRLGTLLLGVCFWWYVLLLLPAWSLTTGFVLLSLVNPDFDSGGFRPLCNPRSEWVELSVLFTVLALAAAAIGWLYVFRHRARWLWIAMVLWSTIPLVLVIGGIGFVEPPSDAVLEENFLRHQSDIEQLARMWAEDKHLAGISPDEADWDYMLKLRERQPEMAISRERWEEYSRLLNKIGIRVGLTRSEYLKQDVRLHVFHGREAFGCLILKGYVRAEQEPTPLLESLEVVPREVGSRGYKHIKDDWYLFTNGFDPTPRMKEYSQIN